MAALLVSLPGCHGCSDDDDDAPVLPPAPPTGLTVTLFTSGRVEVCWTDNSSNEAGFLVERSPDGLAWTAVATVPADTTCHVDRGLVPDTPYFYRVSATGNGGSLPTAPVAPTTGSVTWGAPAPALPTARIGASAVYDPVGDRMILFGGDDAVVTGTPPNDTSNKNDAWTLNLATFTWSALAVSGTPPTPRWFHTAVYDSFRSRMLLFAGDTASNTLGSMFQNDVWELTLPALGTPTWNQLAPDTTLGNPPVRANHTAVFDDLNRRMIVFGGADLAILDDAWALDVSATADGAWIPLAAAPAPRASHSAVYDSAGQRMVVFGGQDGSMLINDVLTLSLPAAPSMAAWSTLVSSAASPASARAGHSAVYDAANRRMVVFGGDAGLGPVDEVWVLPLVGTPSFTLAAPAGGPPVPASRLSHTAIYDPDPIRERMVVYGGDDGSLTPFDDLAWPLGF